MKVPYELNVSKQGFNYNVVATSLDEDFTGKCELNTCSADNTGVGMYTNKENTTTLISIKTDVEALNKGLATAVMEKLCSLLDEDGVNCELAVDAENNYAEESLGNEMLEKFFRKFGFEDVRGRCTVLFREAK